MSVSPPSLSNHEQWHSLTNELPTAVLLTGACVKEALSPEDRRQMWEAGSSRGTLLPARWLERLSSQLKSRGFPRTRGLQPSPGDCGPTSPGPGRPLTPWSNFLSETKAGGQLPSVIVCSLVPPTAETHLSAPICRGLKVASKSLSFLPSEMEVRFPSSRIRAGL